MSPATKMNQLAHPPSHLPRAQAAANYASAAEQAEELKANIAQARTNIKVHRRNIEEANRQIEANEDYILDATEQRQKLLKKKRTFARAEMELKEIDEE